MKGSIRLLTIALVIFVLSYDGFSQKKKLDFSFCKPELPKRVIDADVNFQVIFRFVLDTNGEAGKVQRIIGEYVKDDQVQKCVDNWKFTGFSTGVKVNIVLRWKASTGWTEMQVGSKGFYRKLTVK